MKYLACGAMKRHLSSFEQRAFHFTMISGRLVNFNTPWGFFALRLSFPPLMNPIHQIEVLIIALRVFLKRELFFFDLEIIFEILFAFFHNLSHRLSLFLLFSSLFLSHNLILIPSVHFFLFLATRRTHPYSFWYMFEHSI